MNWSRMHFDQSFNNALKSHALHWLPDVIAPHAGHGVGGAIFEPSSGDRCLNALMLSAILSNPCLVPGESASIWATISR